MSLNQASGFQIGDMLGNGLLRYGKRCGELMNGGRAGGEPVKDGSASGIGQGSESEAQRIHNLMVVDFA